MTNDELSLLEEIADRVNSHRQLLLLRDNVISINFAELGSNFNLMIIKIRNSHGERDVNSIFIVNLSMRPHIIFPYIYTPDSEVLTNLRNFIKMSHL